MDITAVSVWVTAHSTVLFFYILRKRLRFFFCLASVSSVPRFQTLWSASLLLVLEPFLSLRLFLSPAALSQRAQSPPCRAPKEARCATGEERRPVTSGCRASRRTAEQSRLTDEKKLKRRNNGMRCCGTEKQCSRFTNRRRSAQRQWRAQRQGRDGGAHPEPAARRVWTPPAWPRAAPDFAARMADRRRSCPPGG